MKPILAALLIVSLGLLSIPLTGAETSKPNLVFILADDLGMDGVSCYGADAHKTPNIDKMAASGTRFETCYASPLCGPSRCLLMTGRYAFRTGGLNNGSWRDGGPGALSKDEWSVAKVLKQAGYVTGQAGKWRQVGESPHDWGFDEYITDPTASGWYWRGSYELNGKRVEVGKDVYNPDIIQNFSIDFVKRHKDQPFFLYYAMHLVHKPTLLTPISPPQVGPERYDDNIK
jgi:arylsulfatase A